MNYIYTYTDSNTITQIKSKRLKQFLKMTCLKQLLANILMVGIRVVAEYLFWKTRLCE